MLKLKMKNCNTILKKNVKLIYHFDRVRAKFTYFTLGKALEK